MICIVIITTPDRDYVLDSCHVIPAPFNRHLRRYQRQGIKFLFRRCFSAVPHSSPSGSADTVLSTILSQMVQFF